MQATAVRQDSKVRLSFEGFVDEVELMFWQKGIENFRVTETFAKIGTRTYEVKNLRAELVDDLIICTDENGVITEYCSPLMMFLKTSVINIYKTCLNDKICFTINFKHDERVKIEEV